MKTGEILVEGNTKQQHADLLTQIRIADLDISVAPHRSINSSQCVISDADLMNQTDADLLMGVKDHGVTAVRRIIMRRGNKEIPTEHFILTFNRSILPEFISAGFIR